MKVLILTTNNSSPKGGSEKLWRELAKGLQSKGHEVIVSIYSHQIAYQGAKLSPEIQVHGRFPKRHGGRLPIRIWHHVFGRLLESRQIQQIIKRKQPDHIFISFGGFAELDNPKLLRTFNALNVEFSAVFHNNTEDYAFQAESIALAQKFCLNAQSIYLVSHRIGEIFQRQIALPGLQYELIVNPMEEPAESSVTIYSDLSAPVHMAFIGTLDISVKGLALLIQSIASDAWPNDDVILNIYGEGKDREVVAQLIKEFGLDHKVHLKGWVDDIEGIWSSHHILVLPSFNEGMPMVVHEAMLRQRIVLATDVGGNSEIIEDGKTGFLAPSATLKHLNHALASCFKQRTQWPCIASSARASILRTRREHATIQTIIDDLSHEQN